MPEHKARADEIVLTATHDGRGILHFPGIVPSSAQAVSECLTQNHRSHHIFFNESNFHNHIVHGLLAMYDMGATAPLIHSMYQRESAHQRTFSDVPAPKITDLNDTSKWSEYLGQAKHYASFLDYFRGEIEKHGYQAIVEKMLFSGTELADNMLTRLFAGLLHPLIHLGYGIEFGQPAIVAEALASTAVHTDWIGELLLPAEKAANDIKEDTSEITLVSLLEDIRADQKLRDSVLWDDENKIRDGLIKRAPEEMISHIKKFKVPVDMLEQKTGEITNATALFTSASQRADKQIKIDFYYMHAHNSCIFMPTFMALPWISTAAKIRFLEWKGRHDLALYASRGSPELRIDDIRNYVPKENNVTNPWLNIFDRALRVQDDGHLIKLVRACAQGEKTCASWQDNQKQGFMVNGDMWMKIAQMAIDSVEEGGFQWARNVGFDEAWKDYGPRVVYACSDIKGGDEDHRVANGTPLAENLRVGSGPPVLGQ